jgi:hypothetical protein
MLVVLAVSSCRGFWGTGAGSAGGTTFTCSDSAEIRKVYLLFLFIVLYGHRTFSSW